MSERAPVVVLGAGYAGLRAALALVQQSGVSVTIIDRDSAPVVKTRLHELGDAAPSVDVARLLSHTRASFVCGEVVEIDRQKQRVRVGERWLPYRFLVVALGSRTSDLGVIGVREHAIALDGRRDSKRLARAVERLRLRGGNLVVVGGGPTGVEAAAEAAAKLGRGRVSLIEASPRLLPNFSAPPRLYTQASLHWLGVRVELSQSVARVDRELVHLKGGETLAYAALLWSAGVEPHPLVAATGLAAPFQRAAVDEFLVSRADPSVYIVGDCAATLDSDAPSAQLAVQQGDFAAQDIRSRLREERREPYHGVVLGQFVSLGCDAVGELKFGNASLPLFGPPAWAAKGAGEARHRLVVRAQTARARLCAALPVLASR